MAPAASSTSRRAFACRRVPLLRYSTPTAREPENNTRVACARRRTSRLARRRTGRRYALALETRTPSLMVTCHRPAPSACAPLKSGVCAMPALVHASRKVVHRGCTLADTSLTCTGPPVHVNDVSASVHPLCTTFLEACTSAGIAHTPDFNGAQAEGAGLWHVTIKDGMRVSSASAYLRPVRRRANLD